MSHLSEEQLDRLVAEERSRDYEPLNEWRTIAALAREEGLIQSNDPRAWRGQPWLQVAAAAVLLAAGIAIGRTTTALPGSEVAAPQQRTDAGTMASTETNASYAPSASQPIRFASVDDASSALAHALTEYQQASAFLAANNAPTAITTDSSRIYTNRLAALEKVRNAMEGALQTAPHDPVINQYYLATMGARVATQELANRQVGLKLRGF